MPPSKGIFKKIDLLSDNPFRDLKAGDEVLISGDIYTARDQAHKRLVELMKKGKRLPIDLKGKIIYYCGPTRTPPGKAIGSCGPTTASRMDKFTEPLLKAGLRAVIGKGRRSESIRKAVSKYKAVYFIATGGAGAYLSKRVISSEVVCFKELGPEAIYRLHVDEFPLIVGIDAKGKDVFANRRKNNDKV